MKPNPEQDADRAAFEKWCYARGYSIYQDIQVGEAYDLVQAAKADSGARNPDLAKMVDDMRVAREALEKAVEAAENFPDIHDGRVEPLQIIEHLHEWEAKYLTFGTVAGAEKALTRLKPYEKLFEKEGE